jgi:hypothetical protein
MGRLLTDSGARDEEGITLLQTVKDVVGTTNLVNVTTKEFTNLDDVNITLHTDLI